MDLATYQTNVQQLLNDPNSQFYPTAFLTNWINRARTYVANKAMCCRWLSPSSGAVSMSVTVTNGGSGYTTPPTVTISGPDALGANTWTHATATATITLGTVTGVTITNAGSGYVAQPTVTFSGGGGTGAAATAVTTGLYLTTTAGQEVYPFAAVNTLLQSTMPGADRIVGVQSVSVSWGSSKPTLDWMDFSTFQAYARSYNTGQNYPAVWSQYSQGETGSAYLYPIPSQLLQMEWDCFVKPLELSQTQTVDIIPGPWTEPVFYYAAYLAYLNAQRKDDANFMKSECDRLLIESRMFVTPPRFPSMYPEED